LSPVYPAGDEKKKKRKRKKTLVGLSEHTTGEEESLRQPAIDRGAVGSGGSSVEEKDKTTLK
jgi:hypothetical protein